jgi:hypothetical protein
MGLTDLVPKPGLVTWRFVTVASDVNRSLPLKWEFHSSYNACYRKKRSPQK